MSGPDPPRRPHGPEAFSQFQYPTAPLRRLDMTRIYREAYERAGHEFDLFAEAEADEEFEDEAVLA